MRSLLPVLLVPLLLGTAGANPKAPEKAPAAKRFLLKLQVPVQSGIYHSAWADGDVVTDHDGSDGRTIVYFRKYNWYDGCTWEASETLKPIAKDKYDYQYREVPIECPKDRAPDLNSVTPRDGVATVHPVADDRPLTPKGGWSKDWRRVRR
jgi:hypothetical protein